MDRPTVTREYRNHHLDSTRWRDYTPRDGDVIITTSYKSGTTFTQSIMAALVYGELDLGRIDEISPWIDRRPSRVALSELYAELDARTEQRFLKSHLALDGLPYFDNVHYLVVARDPRDVFMSMANHYGNYSDLAYETFNDDCPGQPLPQYPGDIHQFWRDWMTRGWFDWESEGYPFWGNMHHVQSYWDYRHLPNLHFLHYADMRADLTGTIRRIANWVGIPVDEATVDRVASLVRFDRVKAVAAELDEDQEAPGMFTGGNSAFFYKGTNGRWRDVLGNAELTLYADARDRVLSPDCAHWLEHGGHMD